MPAWRGSIADTIRLLLDEGKTQAEAVAIAHRLAAQHGAAKAAISTMTSAAVVSMLDDAALLGAHARLHASWPPAQHQVAGRWTEPHALLVAEMVARGIEHRSTDELDAAAHRSTRSQAIADAQPVEAEKAATHMDPENPGVMVAWTLERSQAESIAMPGGEPAEVLHCTLGYLGRAKDIGPEKMAAARGAVLELIPKLHAVSGRLGGLGRFASTESSDGLDVIYAAVDVPGLVEIRQQIAERLDEIGAPFRREHGWTPHITLAYVDPTTPTPELSPALRASRVTVDKIAWVVGGEAENVELCPAPLAEKRSWLVKGVGEQRYTLSVAYPANQIDAHGEFATPEELEAAAWRYMTGARRVGIMHEGRGDSGTAGAGEIVESYIYRGPDWRIGGELVQDGDWLVGIIWTPDAWQQITAGNYAGLSFQGLVSKTSAEAPVRAANGEPG